MDAPCADAIMHQINHSPDSVVFDPYGSLRFEEMPSNAADIGSNRSDEITGHVHDYVPLPERFGGSAPVAPTKPDEALLRLPSELSHLGSRRRGPRPSSTGGAVSSVATTPAPTKTAALTAKAGGGDGRGLGDSQGRSGGRGRGGRGGRAAAPEPGFEAKAEAANAEVAGRGTGGRGGRGGRGRQGSPRLGLGAN